MARGDSLSRQLQLWLRLLSERELDVQSAAAAAGCTRRTIYRDLEVLQRAGMPLFQEPDGRRVRWKLLDGFHRSLAVQFTVQEAMALVAGEQLLSALDGTVFAQAARTAVAKVRNELSPALRDRLSQLSKHVLATSTPGRRLAQHRRHLDLLIEASEACDLVRLSYRKLNARKAERYTIEPHHIHVQGSSVYLVGWARERRAARIFLLDRVEDVARLGVRFERRPELGPGVFSQGAFGLWDAPARRVRLRFSGTAATIVAEQQFHETQQLTKLRNGALMLEMNVPISPSLKAWIRGFGDRVRIESPPDLLDV